MKYIFLFGLFPETFRKTIENDSVGNIQYAANNLQWSIVSGFDHFVDFNIINLPFVGSFPTSYRKAVMPSFDFSFNEKQLHKNIGFINIKFVKHYFRYLQAIKSLRRVLKDVNEKCVIVIYSLNSPFIRAAIRVKNQFENVKLCVIAPDLPEFMSESKKITSRLIWSVESKLVRSYVDKIDSFVFLTKYMAKEIGAENKPWVVVEGIYNSVNKDTVDKIKKEHKTVLYTGTLEQRYGILNLLEAFSRITDPEYKLWICGDGNTRQFIIDAAKRDRRITYFGLKPRNEIIKLQKEATILINPRNSESNYTKFSFPSKTMEYLASGTPTLIYRLEGIPDEYYSYVFTIEDNTIESLKNKIIEVCELPLEERDRIGRIAKEFIIEGKNPVVQCKRIIDMITKL